MGRMRSMKNDVNDDKAFRYSRSRHLGVQVSSEYYQSCPMFLTREGSTLNIIGKYRGASAFLISNGPSLLENDLGLLKKPGIITMGMNNGPKTFRPDYWICVDDPTRFLKSIWLDPKITKFVPQATFEKQIWDAEKWEKMKMKVGDCPNVIGFRRNEKFHAERFLWEDKFNWGNHKDYGGGRSVMLPALRMLFLMGFRKIYLLGCDFNMTQKETYHFDEQRNKGAVKGNMNTYKRLKEEYLPQLKPYFEAAGLKIYNCNPKSNLDCFEFVDYKKAIEDATRRLGDIENERSWGMYSSPKDKGEWKDELPDAEKKNLTPEKRELMAKAKEDLKVEKLGKKEEPILTISKFVHPAGNDVRITSQNIEEAKEIKEIKEVKEVKEGMVKEVKEIKEGTVKKGGVNKPPTTPPLTQDVHSKQGHGESPVAPKPDIKPPAQSPGVNVQGGSINGNVQLR